MHTCSGAPVSVELFVIDAVGLGKADVAAARVAGDDGVERRALAVP